ncbi:bifunctional DNA-formamidopyrimidine glycosylase/DNA-(apurinic or apyrimidinic site) lyase [Dubosiella newyorkensis]|jgi:formamidopyrimidine-DNA glycosylase|uniref:Formamidopyrimidine-DNA glycosylase n=4 Tax=Dubosiella newyorkensis TaxID=1862672 RepID=A0A1U7NKY4_9FIRM|nr:bifunctional DNA-formamidopyrimidine glycosylase/DNA-(apurinic or apyrimidinic site) lyase [Dubosiella newyorkensis]MCI9040441.1 bifunctional DNA-formamidopyrimidine glycosylase/DNA-(apurinic or apyrimidinic site) lyase [Dubosiella newyorkensis]OLU45255.1 DNA-formamidopyrimidine glycosylase [Dubosiella newyorkensis]
MPEAPEVQTVLSTLEHQIKGVKILKAKIYHEKLSANMEAETMCKSLKGQSIESFFRIGKYLGFETQDYDWICHLRMEGKFYLMDAIPEPKDKHIHAIFTLADGRYLCYHDTRKFGRMYLYPKTQDKASLPCFQKIGKDYLEMSGHELYEKTRKIKREIKFVLLDQSIMAGIGNIYADEILFASRLDPRTPANHLDEHDCDEIVAQTKRILQGATRAGGTTIRSYTSSLGVSGRFQLELKAHKQEGKECPICKGTIEKIKVNQRSTYLCPHCQKRK